MVAGRMDGDPTGTVDVNDLTLVLSNFGTTYGAGSGPGMSAVPEPCSIALAALALVGVWPSLADGPTPLDRVGEPVFERQTEVSRRPRRATRRMLSALSRLRELHRELARLDRQTAYTTVGPPSSPASQTWANASSLRICIASNRPASFL